MKKATSILIVLLFVLTALFPAGTLLSACFGYILTPRSILAYAIALLALSAGASVLSMFRGSGTENQTVGILSALLAPLSMVNAALCMLRCRSSVGMVVACTLVTASCCCLLAGKYGKPAALRIVALTLALLMIVPIGIFAVVSDFFGNFGANRVVQTLNSPDKTHYAEIVENKRGVLGGDTYVEVYERGIDMWLFRIQKKPQRLYSDDWREYDYMEIYWEDNDCLVINSEKYAIRQ